MEPPDFSFRTDKPINSPGGLNDFTWPWAVCERLDYIAAALYELTRRYDETSSQDDPLQKGESDRAE